MTYLLLDLVFLVVSGAVAGVALRRAPAALGGRRGLRALGNTLLVLLVMTAVFDNVMISAGLVAYDDARRTGLSVGLAPVEDFAYPVAAVLLLPAVWALLERRVQP